ncbi:MAG: PQQ-binding-like beta-propeller repeat protein [Muribaculaceae bacterium]|nr:PQQ-binding-like beta-propeller repeat protein [Muribaculaceae bacterium]
MKDFAPQAGNDTPKVPPSDAGQCGTQLAAHGLEDDKPMSWVTSFNSHQEQERDSKMKTTITRAILALIMLALPLLAAAQRLAILSDIHVSPGNDNEAALRLAVQEINAGDADAVLMTGDLTNEGSDVQLLNVKAILDGINKPLYVIPGNHENNWSQSACKTFNDLWGSDRFVFELGNLVVVGMNCGPFMKMGDGHIKQEDLLWLDRTLAERVTPGKRVLSVNHYPLLDDLDNYRDYVDVLKKYPVITHQSGHYHSWKQYETCGISGVMVRALDMRDNHPGYTLLDVDLDRMWIHVYNKVLGSEPELKYAYKINLDYYDLPPQAKVGTVPAGFRVERVYADDASIFTRLGVDEHDIYFGNSLGWVKALDKATGRVRWQHKTGAMLFSRPAVANDVLVVPTADKRLLWIDKRTGKVRYEYEAAGPYVADGVVANGVLYQGGYKTFQAWDVKRRRLLWHYDSINNYCQAAPVVDGGDVVFGAWDTRLRVLDRRTGALRWQWDNGKPGNLFSPGNVVPVVTPGKVIIVAPDRVATALDRSTGQLIWREKNQYKVRESLGRSVDGRVAYAKTMDGELVAMSTEGDHYQLLWMADAGFGYEHAPCIVLEHQGFVLMGSRRGMLAVFNAATHERLFTCRMGTSEVNGFEVDAATGDVYCSLIEGAIYRISLPKN